MNSRFPAIQHAPASRQNPAVNPVADVQPDVRENAAANDETRASIFGDPLWGMAIASGILFAVLAALIAIG
jgi:hypothetical protein